MRLVRYFATLTSLTLLAVLQLSACGDTVESCEDAGNCATGGSGSGSGGDTTDTGSGGDHPGSGGGEGDGDGDTTDTETGGGTTGNGDGDTCVPAICQGGHCVEDECVECVHGDDSKSCKSNSKPVCLEDDTCAQCASNDDCTDPEASVCNDDNECVACTDDEGCSHLDTTNHCLLETNTCVECTIETETDKCGSKSCDPKTYSCTETTTNTIDTCEECVADSECIAGHHCVPMEYKGVERGGYCLNILEDQEVCPQPYRVPIDGRTTLSDVTGEKYCGIDESLTTCEAVLALIFDSTSECEPTNTSACPESGLCRPVEGSGNICTYECSGLASHCPPGLACGYGPATGGSSGSEGSGGSGGSSNTGGSTGTGGQKYCGGGT